MPGATLAVNHTGRPERVMGPDQPIVIKLVVQSTGQAESDRLLGNWIKRITATSGQGDVQVAFGSS
jgi:hypothetical protein